MQFKIGQQMITIMNMFNIIVQHTIKVFNYPPPCRQMCPLHRVVLFTQLLDIVEYLLSRTSIFQIYKSLCGVCFKNRITK